MKYIKLFEEFRKEPVPGDAPGNAQLHVFDFDDTLAVSKNSTAIALFNDGKPLHKNREDVMEWLKKIGLDKTDLLKGPNGNTIEETPRTKIWTAYIKSSALAQISKKYNEKYITGSGKIPDEGTVLVVDYTPSSFIGRSKPIEDVIDKLKQANDDGAKTVVMTARKGEGSGVSIDGKEVPHSNVKDVKAYLKARGAEPDKVFGVAGKNKADKIKDEFLGAEPEPEEIHFYDDDESNIDAVNNKLGGKVDSEVFTYGPGKFDKKEADPKKPNRKYPKK